MGIVWPNPKEYMIKDAERTDGQARSLMIKNATSGNGKSQKYTIENTDVALAFVIGINDVGINGKYIKSLSYKHPPEISELPCGHDTFLEPSEQFNLLLNDFALRVFGDLVHSE